MTTVEAPRRVAFAGPLGLSSARWGMELESIDEGHTATGMWVEVELESLMRAIPVRAFKGRIEGVMDVELARMKAAVESPTPGGPNP